MAHSLTYLLTYLLTDLLPYYLAHVVRRPRLAPRAAIDQGYHERLQPFGQPLGYLLLEK